MKSSYGPLPMSRPLAETMPAVTGPPRPKGLPTARTQSPIRGLASGSFVNRKSPQPPGARPRPGSAQFWKREVRASPDLDQREVGGGVGADHLGLKSLAVVGG